MTKKHLTLMEEAQHRADYRSLTEDQREVNEETYVSIMECIKELSDPNAKTYTFEEMMAEMETVMAEVAAEEAKNAG